MKRVSGTPKRYEIDSREIGNNAKRVSSKPTRYEIAFRKPDTMRNVFWETEQLQNQFSRNVANSQKEEDELTGELSNSKFRKDKNCNGEI